MILKEAPKLLLYESCLLNEAITPLGHQIGERAMYLLHTIVLKHVNKCFKLPG